MLPSPLWNYSTTFNIFPMAIVVPEICKKNTQYPSGLYISELYISFKKKSRLLLKSYCKYA
jgi:hypothetical protein